jgi:hypothetical protein
MSNYFNKFPKIAYFFGDETSPTVFQELNKYTDLIDLYRDDAGAYIEYEIKDGERPDTLSYLLYGKSEYEFTFFLMNERLRETGWPMTLQQVYDRAQNDLFKNYTCKLLLSTADSAAEFSDIYPAGTSVLVSGKSGTVIRKNLDVGEITIASDSDLTGSVTLAYQTPTTDPQTIGASLSNTVYEYEGTHHYENDSDQWLDKYFDDLSGATLKTNLDYLIDQNDESKRIVVLKKELVGQLVGELKRLLT